MASYGKSSGSDFCVKWRRSKVNRVEETEEGFGNAMHGIDGLDVDAIS